MGESADYETLSLDSLPVGATIGGYAIRRMIGHGGFGITYEAANRVTGKVVAIKEFFPASMVRRDGHSRLIYSTMNAETIAWALRKFEETTTALCGLSHPNIVQVYDYVPANDTGYMIMELLDGETLKAWLKSRSGAPRLDELRPIVDPVMEALTYVHGSGLIHRDIAPDNILITTQGRPVLIDFGSASRDLSDARHHGPSGTVGLTKRFYTAPEQMLPKARPTPEADIYSMGAVLYHALAGVEPADGQERKDCLFQGDPDPYKPLADRQPAGCPPGAAAAIDQALAVRPAGRLHKMVELRDALSPPPLPLPASPPVVVPAQAAPPPPRKRGWLGIAAALAGVLIVGLLAGEMLGERGMQPRVASGPQAPAAPPPRRADASPPQSAAPEAPKPSPASPPEAAKPGAPPEAPKQAMAPDAAKSAQPPEPPKQAAPPDPAKPAQPPEGPRQAAPPEAAKPLAPPPEAPKQAPPADSAMQTPPPDAAKPPVQPPMAAKPATPPDAPRQAPPPEAPKPAPTSAGSVFRDCPDCPEVVVVPAGEFTMGSGATPYDRPAHRVSIGKPLAIGRTEVTFTDWNACVAGGGCKYKPDDQGFGGDDHPVINVSWFDAKDYIAWLSKTTGKTYRLPSEAEWEYAAHGGTTTAYAWGSAVGRNKANCADCGSSQDGRGTAPAKSFEPNGYGLYDMAGNAAEWVEDCWNTSYRGAPKDGSAWESGSCGQRVLRGGSFDTSSAYAKPTARFRYDADVRYWANGFRVVRELP